MNWIHISIIVNCAFGLFIAGWHASLAWDEQDDTKGRFGVILMCLIFVVFGLLAIIADITWYIIRQLWKSLQIKSWISLYKGKFDHLDDYGRGVTLKLWQSHKNDWNPFSKMWLKEIAKRNGINLNQ